MRSKSLLSYVIFVVLLGETLAKVGFVKDQSVDAEFPVWSEYDKTSENGIPMGHLRPLGWQRKPQRKVRVIPRETEPHETWKTLVRGPAIIKKLLNESKAVANWETDDYLKQNYGNLTVVVTVKKEVLKTSYSKSMPFKKFLLDYMYEDWLLTNTLPQEMEAELPLPYTIGCGSFTKHMQEAELWVSSGGTSSLLHSHDDISFHCVLSGRKDFIIIDPQFKDTFEWKPKYTTSLAGSSPLDMDMINMYKYKKIAQIPWTYATLNKTDCILIPPGLLHQVRSYGRSITFTVLISGFKAFENRHCPQDDKYQTLADVHKMWTYANGTRQLSHVTLRPRDVKYHLLQLMRAKEDLTFEAFEYFYDSVMQYFPVQQTAKQVFKFLDPQNSGSVTRSSLLAASHATLKRIANILNSPNMKGRPIILHDEF